MIVTSTRADYGLLRPVIRSFSSDGFFEVAVAVTGSHLCGALGHTVSEIEDDKIKISARLDILEGRADMPVDSVICNAITEFSKYFRDTRPDAVVLLGDRSEIFATATAAALLEIPIAHISGGETTQGAKDEFFRHCITKMSSLHFASTEDYRRRVIQLGEQPKAVFNVGSLGAENILTILPVPKERLSETVGFSLKEKYLLATYHPETLGSKNVAADLEELLLAIDTLGTRCLFTMANADDGGAIINERLAQYCEENSDRAALRSSLGAVNYLSAMRWCAAVVGNSSSAIVESPTLKKPAVNIGERQAGRIMGANTICCDAKKEAIVKALRKAMSLEFSKELESMTSPYGGENVSGKIANITKTYLSDGNRSSKKVFYDII
ncbi:MAG: UDP-N-acetylglucosamine 2-epimerase [Oscillospiraceae bacterium]